MTWLRCEALKENPNIVETLWYHARRIYEEKIISMKNFSSKWIDGSTNHKTSVIVDHANSDQHKEPLKKQLKCPYH